MIVGLDFFEKVGQAKTKLMEFLNLLAGEDRIEQAESQGAYSLEFSEKDKSMLTELLKKHEDIFVDDIEKLGCCSMAKHEIDTGDARPFKEAVRRMPHKMKEKVAEELQKMKDAGIIQESKSDWSSAIVPVEKKNGKVRICIDYRRLNDLTRKDNYPIPRMDEQTDKFFGIRVFSTLDCASGYYQVMMDPKDRHKTAFSTPLGLFEFVRMPFGLCNAPSTFQRVMDRALEGLIGLCVYVYVDDMVVYSKTVEDHMCHLEMVFNRLKEVGLSLSREKCSFMCREVRY